MAIGRKIAEAWALPRVEPFAFLTAGAQAVPWIGFEWFSELSFYLIWATAGPGGLIAFKALMAAATGYAIDGGLRKAECPLAVRASALCVFALLTQKRWMLEPEIFTFVLLALVSRIIGRRTSPLRKFELAQMAAIFCFWANVHGGFVYGLGLVFIDMFGPRGIGKRAAAFGVCFAATLLNPYGWEIYSVPLFLLTRLGELHVQNVEWTAPILLPGLSNKAVYLLPLSGLLLLRTRQNRGLRFDRRDLLCVVLFGLWGCLSLRNAAVAGVVLVPVVARLFAATLLRESKKSSLPARAGRFLPVGVAGLWLFMISEVFALGSPLEGIVWRYYPRPLVETAYREARSDAVLLPFDWAGYAVWNFYPARRVYHYGRLDAFHKRITEQHAARSDPEKWRRFLEENRIGIVIEKHPRTFLPGTLHGPRGEMIPVRRSPFYAYFPKEEWELAAWNDQGLLFKRRISGKENGYRLLDPHDIEYLGELKARGWLDRKLLLREFNRHRKQAGPSRFDRPVKALLDL